MFGIAIAAAMGLLLLGAGKKTKINLPPPLPRVTIGPARVLPKKTVARPAPKTGPKPVPATKKAVRVVLKSTPAETVAVTRATATQLQESLSPNPVAAKRGAQPVADHVRNKGAKYDRAYLASWQALASLKPDGLYGPKTQARLRELGAKNVTGILFKGAK